MEQLPKERIVYDEDSYFNDPYYEEGNEKGLWGELSDEVFNYADDAAHQYVTPEDWQRYLSSVIQMDYAAEIEQLTAYFDGERGDMSAFVNPLGGNTILVSGCVGRWDGTSTGFTPYKSFEEAIDTSPSRLGGDNVFADCEIQKVWDENGHLYIHGAHHDGEVTVELRQLTGAGMEALEAIEEAWSDEPFTVRDKTYDGSERSFVEALHDLWNSPDLAPTPRYMEQCFGCPAEEWNLDPLPLDAIQFDDEISEVGTVLNFYIPVTFDVDAVFGTDVQSLDNDDWLNIYANFDMAHGTVEDHLELSVNRSDGDIEYRTYPLGGAQRDALRQKMDAYCREQTGMNLEAFSRDALKEGHLDQPEGTPSLSATANECRAASEALGQDGPADRDAQVR